MVDITHQREAVRYAAQHTSCTVEQVDSILSDVERTLQDQLVDLYESAWGTLKRQTRVTRVSNDSVVFGLAPEEWRNDYLDELDLSDEELIAVIAYHQYLAREIWGFAVETRTSSHENFVPVFISLPDEWSNADDVTAFRFKRYLEFGLTPTEALDYWLCEFRNWDSDTVAAWRDVDRTAVNKSLRQAREKLGDYENATTHYEEKGAHPVPMEELDEESQLEPPEAPNLSSVGDN